MLLSYYLRQIVRGEFIAGTGVARAGAARAPGATELRQMTRLGEFPKGKGEDSRLFQR
jgi:hypothetical protein